MSTCPYCNHTQWFSVSGQHGVRVECCECGISLSGWRPTRDDARAVHLERAESTCAAMQTPLVTSETVTALRALLKRAESDVRELRAELRECEECDEEPEDDSTCTLCMGTGIGQHGDPSTSRCSSCGGRGFHQSMEAD